MKSANVSRSLHVSRKSRMATGSNWIGRKRCLGLEFRERRNCGVTFWVELLEAVGESSAVFWAFFVFFESFVFAIYFRSIFICGICLCMWKCMFCVCCCVSIWVLLNMRDLEMTRARITPYRTINLDKVYCVYVSVVVVVFRARSRGYPMKNRRLDRADCLSAPNSLRVTRNYCHKWNAVSRPQLRLSVVRVMQWIHRIDSWCPTTNASKTIM